MIVSWLLFIWVVVSNIFYFHPYLGKDSQFDYYFSDGLKPPTSYVLFLCVTGSGFVPWRLTTETHNSCFTIMTQTLWSKTTWLHARAWLTARVSGVVPTAVFGRPDIARTALCTFCGNDLTLHHVLLCKARNIHAPDFCSWPEIFSR